MKRICIIFALVSMIFVTNKIKSQVVDGINYQAVVIDENGKEIAGMDFKGIILPNKAINIRFTILRESSSWNSIEYQETQTISTDATGLLSCVVGHGQTTSDSPNTSILNVSWGKNKLFLKVELDINQSGDYKLNGIEQIQAVPYSFFSLSAIETDPKWSGLADQSGVIGRDGNVGVGTTMPLSKFDVNGGVAIGSYAGNNASPTNSLIVSNSVGIGTVTPEAKLDITGNIKITDGTQAKGHVLTSDANGLASWQPTVPAGGIIMYSGDWNFDAEGLGTGTNVGWALCNGNNGTPDLTDKFVMGTATSTSLKETGGSNSYQLTTGQLPSHSHSKGSLGFSGKPLPTVPVSTDGLETWGGDGSSKNVYRIQADGPSPGCKSSLIVNPGTPTGSITGSTDVTGNNDSIDNRPAFLKLAYIMKL